MARKLKRGVSTSHQLVGWREWVQLPTLQVPWIKCKVDTGARSSCLHAFDKKIFERDGKDWVRFSVHPLQRRSKPEILCEAPVVEYRRVRSSSGHTEKRPVIESEIIVAGRTWTIELTLSNRDEMGFRMLLGREAIKGRFLVDSGNSYYSELAPSELTKKKKSN